SRTGGEVWTRETGLHVLAPRNEGDEGNEAVVDTADFPLAGRATRTVHHTVRRIARAGRRTPVRHVRDLGGSRTRRPAPTRAEHGDLQAVLHATPGVRTAPHRP